MPEITVNKGSRYQVATKFSEAVEPTEMSANGNDGIAVTLSDSDATAIALQVGDIVVYDGGWSLVSGGVFHVTTGGSSAILSGFDVSDAKLFPAERAYGTIRKVEAWSQLSGVSAHSSSGGEQKKQEITFIDQDQVTLPDGHDPYTHDVTFAYLPTDKEQKGVVSFLAYSESLEKYTVMRIAVNKNGWALYLYGLANVVQVQIQDGGLITSKLTLQCQVRPTVVLDTAVGGD